jgi:hypothetical protein
MSENNKMIMINKLKINSIKLYKSKLTKTLQKTLTIIFKFIQVTFIMKQIRHIKTYYKTLYLNSKASLKQTSILSHKIYRLARIKIITFSKIK